jgi:hypothetical protein
LRLKKDLDFTTEEKEFIKNFGLKRLRNTNPAQRKVNHEDLKNAYKREEQFAGFWRKGEIFDQKFVIFYRCNFFRSLIFFWLCNLSKTTVLKKMGFLILRSIPLNTFVNSIM